MPGRSLQLARISFRLPSKPCQVGRASRVHVVQNHDLFSILQESLHQIGADESRAARNQYAHDLIGAEKLQASIFVCRRHGGKSEYQLPRIMVLVTATANMNRSIMPISLSQTKRALQI